MFQNLFLTYSPPILGRINDFDRMSVVLNSIEFSEDRSNLAIDDVFRCILWEKDLIFYLVARKSIFAEDG